jgi:AraC-like DNA-binding protein
MTLEVRTLAATYYDGHRIEPNAHPWGQLIYAVEGAMRLKIGDRLWIVPPAQAVWAPPRATHEIHAHGTFTMHTLYLSPRLSTSLGAECRGLDVGPLLRELILHTVAAGMLDGAKADQRRLISVLLDQLRSTGELPLSIRLPADRRARLVAERLQQNPCDKADLDELAKHTGASARTLQRLFRGETGLRFGEWRQRLRMLHAVALLGTGVSVTSAGEQAGYATTSAFIATFRKLLGSTPTRYRHKKILLSSTQRSCAAPTLAHA